ncbi:MAG: hypothetical protein HY392_01245 [Candidatus Diapherotrites archaeon]|nr:hypothetical protein [Candidatus Diapherotrites archaeon]
MKDHDLIRGLEEQKQLIEQISPSFSELTLDLDEVLEKSSDPKFVAALLFRLAEERRKTNLVLEQINDKFDKMMFELKTRHTNEPEHTQNTANTGVFLVLAEQDQAILKFIEHEGKATAEEIKQVMHYKGLNAASQRLNKLFREGYLKKLQSGKKVLYLTKN